MGAQEAREAAGGDVDFGRSNCTTICFALHSSLHARICDTTRHERDRNVITERLRPLRPLRLRLLRVSDGGARRELLKFLLLLLLLQLV